MTKTKTLNFAFAFLLLIPCLFLFTACGGEQIEQTEALDVLSSASTHESILNTDSFTNNQIVRLSITMNDETTKQTSNITANVSGTTRVYVNENSETIVQGSINGTVTTKMSNLFGNGSATQNVNSTYKVANIDGNYYKFDEANKIKEQIFETEFDDYLFTSSVLFADSSNIITEEMLSIETAEVQTSLLKVGENDYNLRFSITESTEEQTLTSIYYYEIRNGQFTKISLQITKTTQEGTYNIYTEQNIQYSSSEITKPDTIADYTETTFDDDILSGI